MNIVIRDREAGNVIEHFETVEEAKETLKRYIAEDVENGYDATEDFYEIYDFDAGEEVE